MLRTNHANFPSSDLERVKYSMDIVGMLLAERTHDIPTSRHPLKLYEICNNPEEMQYLWTAAMVYGMNLPGMKFKKDAIECAERSGFTQQFESREYYLSEERNYIDCYIYAGRRYISDPVDQTSQTGWFDAFSSVSLYETKFKMHLTSDMFSIQKYREMSGFRLRRLELISDSALQVLQSKRRAEKRVVNVAYGDIDHKMILAGTFLEEFQNDMKCDSGWFLPHDGYLQLAFILIEDYIKENPCVGERVIYINGNLNMPLKEAAVLYCVHNAIDVKDASCRDIVKPFTKLQFARYIERIYGDGVKEGIFSDNNMRKFLIKLNSLPKVKLAVKEKRKNQRDLQNQKSDEKKLEKDRQVFAPAYSSGASSSDLLFRKSWGLPENESAQNVAELDVQLSAESEIQAEIERKRQAEIESKRQKEVFKKWHEEIERQEQEKIEKMKQEEIEKKKQEEIEKKKQEEIEKKKREEQLKLLQEERLREQERKRKESLTHSLFRECNGGDGADSIQKICDFIDEGADINHVG